MLRVAFILSACVWRGVIYTHVHTNTRAICIWVIIYLTLLETLQAKGRTYATTRFVVKYKQLFGWGVPGILTGMTFGINGNPRSEKGFTCA